MPPVQDHHPRNHAQHNTGHPQCKESPIESERAHKVAVSNRKCIFAHPQSNSYTSDTYHDKFAHASAPAYSDHSSHRSAMRVAAPQSMESSSSLSTLLSEVSPPHPSTHKPHPHKVRRQKAKRLPLGRRKSTGAVVQVSPWKPESPPSSLPLPTPRLAVLPPTTDISQTATTTSKPPRIHVLPSTPEARQSPPLLGKSPPPILPPSTQPPRPPKGQFLSPPPPGPSQRKRDKQPAVEKPHVPVSLVSQPAPENLLGTYKGPPYVPFAGPGHVPGYKPRLQRHAPYIDLRDCWRTPEAELSARFLGRWNSGGQSAGRGKGKKALLGRGQMTFPDEAEEEEEEVEQEEEADEDTPLLGRAPQGVSHTATRDPSISTTATESPSRIQTLVSTVIFPLVTVYAYFASAINTYLHDRDAVSGQLGSHDTETAHWLRRVESAFPAREGTALQRHYGSFSSVMGVHTRTGSRGSASTVSSHGRKGSMVSEVARGDSRVVRWGSWLGDEYDPR